MYNYFVFAPTSIRQLLFTRGRHSDSTHVNNRSVLNVYYLHAGYASHSHLPYPLVLISAAVVGLTGGIATGKSTVSRLLRDEYHVPIIDADVLAHRVYEPGTRAYKKIVAAFGEQVVSQDGSGRIDRKKVGEIVFGNEEKRRVLNGIVHPEVRWEMLKEVVWCWWRGESWVVLDVPLLIESGIWRWVGEVVVVYWCVAFGRVIGVTDVG